MTLVSRKTEHVGEAHVVPIGDLDDHFVTDRGIDDEANYRPRSGWGVFELDPDVDDLHTARVCTCFPSVTRVYNPQLRGFGRVITHYAFDGRP